MVYHFLEQRYPLSPVPYYGESTSSNLREAHRLAGPLAGSLSPNAAGWMQTSLWYLQQQTQRQNQGQKLSRRKKEENKKQRIKTSQTVRYIHNNWWLLVYRAKPTHSANKVSMPRFQMASWLSLLSFNPHSPLRRPTASPIHLWEKQRLKEPRTQANTVGKSGDIHLMAEPSSVLTHTAFHRCRNSCFNTKKQNKETKNLRTTKRHHSTNCQIWIKHNSILWFVFSK